MITKCVVYGCNNNTTTAKSGIQFFSFPKHPEFAQQWISACWGPEEIDLETARVCSIHFHPNSYTYKMLDYLGIQTQVLKHDAVPTLHLPSTHVILQPHMQNQVILGTSEMKPVVVYELHKVSNNISISDLKSSELTYIQSDTTYSDNVSRKNESSDIKETQVRQETIDNESNKMEQTQARKKMTDNKCQLTAEQMEQIKRENEILEKEVDELQNEVDKLSSKSLNKTVICRRKNSMLRKSIDNLYNLKTKSLTHSEQKSILSKVFSEAQIKMLLGKKKIYWSDDDMAVGFTIKHLSNKRCYMYLTKNLHIPLPALSSIRRWSTMKKGNFGNEDKKIIESNQNEDDSSD